MIPIFAALWKWSCSSTFTDTNVLYTISLAALSLSLSIHRILTGILKLPPNRKKTGRANLLQQHTFGFCSVLFRFVWIVNEARTKSQTSFTLKSRVPPFSTEERDLDRQYNPFISTRQRFSCSLILSLIPKMEKQENLELG